MTQQQKEIVAGVYNTLATLIPVPSEEFSTKHADCLRSLRVLLQEEAKNKKEPVNSFD